jgi:hypothetical protein
MASKPNPDDGHHKDTVLSIEYCIVTRRILAHLLSSLCRLAVETFLSLLAFCGYREVPQGLGSCRSQFELLCSCATVLTILIVLALWMASGCSLSQHGEVSGDTIATWYPCYISFVTPHHEYTANSEGIHYGMHTKPFGGYFATFQSNDALCLHHTVHGCETYLLSSVQMNTLGLYEHSSIMVFVS